MIEITVKISEERLKRLKQFIIPDVEDDVLVYLALQIFEDVGLKQGKREGT